MIYLDTSALIKRFATETGSVVVDHFIQQRELVATATITYAELYAGLTRKYRQGHLLAGQYALACRQVEEEWPAYSLVELQQDVLELARELIKRHVLRGFDAIHLASALTLKVDLDGEMIFLASDEKLLRAASAELLSAINVEKTGHS